MNATTSQESPHHADIDADSPDYSGVVVVGVDGSENGFAAARWANMFAEAISAPLHVVTNLAADAEGIQDVFDWANDAGATSSRVDGLLRTALKQASNTARLVVLPMRGSQAPRAQLLDVIADEVLLNAGGPLALIPEGSFPTIGGPVVVGVDPEDVDDAALDMAAEVAASTEAPLILMMAHEPNEELTAAVQSIAADQRQRHPQLHVDIVTSPWTPADALAATSHDAAIVVVGTRGGGGPRTPRRDSQSRRLLRLSACPVIVVP